MSNEQTQTQKKPGRKVIPAKNLIPDISSDSVSVGKEVVYWVGVTPDCPTEGIDVAGMNFPKMNEKLVDDPMLQGKKKRIPQVGALVMMTEARFKFLAERVARLVVRFTDGKGAERIYDKGTDLEALAATRRKGHVITIPTKAETEARRKLGRQTNEYIPDRGDAPAARFMFAIPCPDQEHPSRGGHYPDTLEKTGLAWPEGE